MRLAPNDAMLHGQLGGLLMRQGAFVQANTHLERSAELFPDRPTTRVSLAALKLKLGEWDAAEREAGAAVTLRPESAPAHANLGRALLQQGRLEEAERHGQPRVELGPDVGSASVAAMLCAQGRARGTRRDSARRCDWAGSTGGFAAKGGDARRMGLPREAPGEADTRRVAEAASASEF
jgi:Flp pilus assembly protein TadD